MSFALRPMTADDLSAVLVVQRLAYGDAYQEAAEVLDAKRQRSPAACWVACDAAGMAGYVFAHDWPGDAPPPLHTALPAAAVSTCGFLHDLAVVPRAHGGGVGAALFAAVQQWSLAAGHEALNLVSLASAAEYWQRFGFVPIVSSERSVMAAYGDGACFMRLPLGG
ncbi:GNAT family N-acetyltransferase [Denitromonas ohlonensis]|nr:GNAT family N-acetyltransferase [Denitromonas ohlonensis]